MNKKEILAKEEVISYENHIFRIPDTAMYQITLSVNNKVVFSALAEFPFRAGDKRTFKGQASVPLGEALEEYMRKSKRRGK